MRLSIRRAVAALLLSPMLLLNVSCESMNSVTDKVMENKETLIGGLAGLALHGVEQGVKLYLR